MKIIHILALAILLLVISSCQKEKNAIDFQYDQTLCSDPWNSGQNSSDETIENSVIEYLDQQKIKAFKVEIDHSNDLTIVCEACNCLSGTKIIVSADEKKEAEMLKIGFTKS